MQFSFALHLYIIKHGFLSHIEWGCFSALVHESALRHSQLLTDVLIGMEPYLL